MAKTLNEYLLTAATNDADLFARLKRMSEGSGLLLDKIMQVGVSIGQPQQFHISIIHRAQDMGWTMAGEAIMRLPKEVRERYPTVPWSAIREMRDIHVHRGEKTLLNPQKAFDRIKKLQAKIVQPELLEVGLMNAYWVEPEPQKEEILNVMRGLRFAIGLGFFRVEAVDAKKDLVTIDPGKEISIIAANLIQCSPQMLPMLVCQGAARSVIVELGDYLKATSLFADELPSLRNALPNAFRQLRNDVAHFNDWRANPDGIMRSEQSTRFLRALDHISQLAPAIDSTVPPDTGALANKYHELIVRRLKPEAMIYLDTVVERVTAMQPTNHRLEQAIILASSKLLRERPLNQASQAIDNVLADPSSLMQRNEQGALMPSPLATSSIAQRLVRDIQDRCTRNHSNSLA